MGDMARMACTNRCLGDKQGCYADCPAVIQTQQGTDSTDRDACQDGCDAVKEGCDQACLDEYPRSAEEEDD